MEYVIRKLKRTAARNATKPRRFMDFPAIFSKKQGIVLLFKNQYFASKIDKQIYTYVFAYPHIW